MNCNCPQSAGSYSAMNAYYEHSLDISMRTSSGDTIDLNFLNQKSVQASHAQDAHSSSASLSFASLEQFSFDISTNGLSAQDKKEIAQFIEIATPYIDNFLSELSHGSEVSPINKIVEQLGVRADELLASSSAQTGVLSQSVAPSPAVNTIESPNEAEVQKDISTIYQERENSRKREALEYAMAQNPVENTRHHHDKRNSAKHDLVHQFDKLAHHYENLDKFFERATTFLEKLVERLDKQATNAYA